MTSETYLVRLHVRLATEEAFQQKARMTSIMFWKGILMILRGAA